MPRPYTRKTRYIEHLGLLDQETLLVSLSDKIHNARASAADSVGARHASPLHAQDSDAVGTRVTSRPPLRSGRATFPHTAPTSGV
jgi:hypothetical protein